MRTVDGVSAWYLDGSPLCHIGGNVFGRTSEGRKKMLGINSVQPWDEIDPASWDPKARLSLLDDMGIYAQILYPNAFGFSSNTAFSITDLKQRALVLQTYNDFLVDVQNESQDRLFPQAVLPVWDMDLTVAEMTRLRDKGIRGFTVSDKQHKVGLPDLDAPYFEPMWTLGNEMQAVFNFHIASGGGGPEARLASENTIKRWGPITNNPLVSNPDEYFDSFGPQRRMAIGCCLCFLSNARIIVNLCMGAFFDRYPHLKIVSVESGLGWIPFILEFMEYHIDEIITDPDEIALQKRRPREYFQDHIYATFWFETSGPARLIEEVGVNNVLVETDVPHSTCLYPNTWQRLVGATAGWDSDTRRRVLQDNAADLYRIPIPAAV